MTKTDRLTLPGFILGMLTIVFALCVPLAADAAGPMAITPAPGYFRLMPGDDEITAISDGTTDLPVDTLLTNTIKDAVDIAGYRSTTPRCTT
ncbi:MAG TPA: hypothetical protein VF798_11780 [Burkholderiaceae bacterium]